MIMWIGLKYGERGFNNTIQREREREENELYSYSHE